MLTLVSIVNNTLTWTKSLDKASVIACLEQYASRYRDMIFFSQYKELPCTVRNSQILILEI
jgi:hypothetical protein